MNGREYVTADGVSSESLIKLQNRGRAYGAQFELFILAIVALCLFEFVLERQSGLLGVYAAEILSLQWMLLAGFAMWCGMFLLLSFGWEDLPLIGLLLINLALYFVGPTERLGADVLVLGFGMTLGKGADFALKEEFRRKKGEDENIFEIVDRKSANVNFPVGLVGLLAFASWWHLDMSNNYYSGPRWMGLWGNPNTYGMLMGAGLTLAIGLLATKERREHKENSNSSFRFILRSLRPFAAIKSAIRNPLSSILVLAIGMLGVGLVMSYSRGAWVATGIALVYLVWCYGKLKWKYVAVGAGLVAIGAGLVWGNTRDSAPWYVKRADLGRASAQNRATAWRAGLEIMRDHPLGVGWNNAVSLYGEKYSPPEGGPGALTTNDYLMLGTELGIPALLCFVTYIALCYRKSPRAHLTSSASFLPQPSSGLRPPSPAPTSEGKCLFLIGSADATDSEREKPSSTALEAMAPVASHSSPMREHESLRAACLAGALVFVVAFWFDGGLFKLPTAAMFWVLLELGAYRAQKVEN